MDCVYIFIAFVDIFIYYYVSVTLNYVGRNDKSHTSVLYILYLRGLLEPESTLLLAYPLRGVHIVALAVA